MNSSETVWYIYDKFNEMMVDYDFGNQIKVLKHWSQSLIETGLSN